MNDLQITLLVVGGGGIVAMIAYNWWQDFRLRKQATERFGDNDQDPLLNGGERVEPGMASEAGMDNPLIAMPSVEDNQLQVPVDKSIFTEFVIHFDSPKDANVWKPLVDSLEHVNRKVLMYSVSSKPSEEDGETLWYKAMPFAGEADSIRVNLQLANRKGALTSIEFSEVLAKLRRFAEEHNADLDFPDMKDVVAKAETLDRAAAALDTLLGLHCMLPETVEEATAIDMLAEAGWVSKGHQWLLSSEAGILASMVLHKAPSKRLLSFNIDVPNSVDPIQALGDVVTLCHAMNEQFGAPLMDDSGTVLSTKAIEGIYEQLLERVRNLDDSGFKPGSNAARLLFS